MQIGARIVIKKSRNGGNYSGVREETETVQISKLLFGPFFNNVSLIICLDSGEHQRQVSLG